MFATEADYEREQEVGAKIEAAWGCKLHWFARMSPIDCWAERNDEMLAIVEIKTRTHSSTKHDTVFLSHRKRTNLAAASAAFNCPGLWVVQFTDGLFSIDVARVTGPTQMVGHNNPRARNDREPCFLVPISSLRPITPRKAA